MKTVVFIIGTNGVGKSTVARALLDYYGGPALEEDQVVYARRGRVAFAGSYGAKYGGVDRLKNEDGSTGTSALAGVVERALRKADAIVCEGSYMDTFGLNLSNALFKGTASLVVSLFADGVTLYHRLESRSAGQRGDGKRDYGRIYAKQRRTMVAARKWESIGVPVLQFNTAQVSVEAIRDAIVCRLQTLEDK